MDWTRVSFSTKNHSVTVTVEIWVVGETTKMGADRLGHDLRSDIDRWSMDCFFRKKITANHEKSVMCHVFFSLKRSWFHVLCQFASLFDPKFWHILDTKTKMFIPIGSMVLLYMVTCIPSIYPLYVSIYTSTVRIRHGIWRIPSVSGDPKNHQKNMPRPRWSDHRSSDRSSIGLVLLGKS